LFPKRSHAGDNSGRKHYHSHMNLIWVPNQQFAIYFLHFCERNSDLGEFCIFVQDENVIPEFRELAMEIGIKFVDWNSATSNTFDNFYMFSWGILSYQETVRSSVNYEKLWLFGDGFNNSFLLHSEARNWKIEGLIYFGYELTDYAFISNDLPILEKKVVIEFQGIAKFVKELQDRRNVSDYHVQINSNSILVLDRYWGNDSYKIANWTNYERYFRSIFSKFDTSMQIVFKGVEKNYSGSADDKRDKIFKIITNSNYLSWDQIVATDSDFRYLTSPEALLLGERISPSSFFSFDSSTSLIASLAKNRVEVIWPDEAELAEIFCEPWVKSLILEKSELYRDVSSQYKTGDESDLIRVKTAGTRMREIIGRFILTHFAQERDALTQERDALTQERDALTQERDALTQERDALVNSTIWRATRFIRALVSFARRNKGSSE
jgi:hypothetical protein